MSRNTATRLSVNQIKQLTPDEVQVLLPNEDQVLAVSRTLRVIICLMEQNHLVEKRVQSRIQSTPLYELVQSVNGIGPI